jgi:TatD DNase family protein
VLAEELGLPLFLHERSAAEDFTKILSGHPEAAKRAVVHCFTGDRATVEKYLELGCMIGITGWVCDDRRNAELLDALEVIPAERLMAETDGPYLLPRGIKGLKNPNVPENIIYVVRKLAEVKGIEEEELRKNILENTMRFFGIKC